MTGVEIVERNIGNEAAAMEHRHAKREPIDVETLVYRQGLPVAWGRALNIGAGGAFIQFRNTMTMNSRYLEVEFTATIAGRNRKYRAQAVVIHRSQTGIGIMFDVHDRSVFQGIRTLVDGESKALIF